jgi:hypothetical protein
MIPENPGIDREQGLRVTKPWGDNTPYDLAVETNGHFLRIQLKCTRFRRGRSYKCHLDSNGHPYTSAQIDFIAACVIPTDIQLSLLFLFEKSPN